MYTLFSRLKLWWYTMLTTRTVRGPFLYFQRVYFLFNLATLVSWIYKPFGQALRTALHRIYAYEAITKNPLGTFSVNAKDDSFTKSLPSFEAKHHSWLDAADHRNTFIDIGANIGFYSMLAVKTYAYTSVHAFEPNPETYERLERNIDLNAQKSVIQPHRLGLSDTTGTATMQAKQVHTGGSTLLSETKHPENYTQIDVPIDTFDTLSAAQHIRPEDISFIKIDVEGYEYQVLRGMQQTLEKLPDGACLFIEIHPQSPHATETKALIESVGFTCIQQSKQNNFLYKKDVPLP